MKTLLSYIAALLICVQVFAQQKPKKELPQPFKGGTEAMLQFFKDSLQVSPDITNARATGLVIFKFTADTKGVISKIVVYYADDLRLTQPAIDALKKTNGKWVIPDSYEFYDFIVPFSFNFVPSDDDVASAQKAMFNFYQHRQPILAVNQVPLNTATLLPTVLVNYMQ